MIFPTSLLVSTAAQLTASDTKGRCADSCVIHTHRRCSVWWTAVASQERLYDFLRPRQTNTEETTFLALHGRCGIVFQLILKNTENVESKVCFEPHSMYTRQSSCGFGKFDPLFRFPYYSFLRRNSRAANLCTSETCPNSSTKQYSSGPPMLYSVSPITTVGMPLCRYSRASEAPTLMFTVASRLKIFFAALRVQ